MFRRGYEARRSWEHRRGSEPGAWRVREHWEAAEKLGVWRVWVVGEGLSLEMGSSGPEVVEVARGGIAGRLGKS